MLKFLRRVQHSALSDQGQPDFANFLHLLKYKLSSLGTRQEVVIKNIGSINNNNIQNLRILPGITDLINC